MKTALFGFGDDVPSPPVTFYVMPWWVSALSIAGAATGAYHGYKRDRSVGWAIAWGLLGGAFPIVTIPVSIAQGFGKPKGR